MKTKTRRMIALLIDYSLILLICYLLYCIIEPLFINEAIKITITFLLIMLSGFLILIKDSVYGYESIGKKIMHLKIYQNGKCVTDKKILFKRNKYTMYGFPFCLFWIWLNGISDGDEKCGTEVVLSYD